MPDPSACALLREPWLRSPRAAETGGGRGLRTVFTCGLVCAFASLAVRLFLCSRGRVLESGGAALAGSTTALDETKPLGREEKPEVKVEEDFGHFEFFVIGGGQGGLSATEAFVDEFDRLDPEKRKARPRIGIADFVEPTAHGTTWGLGGTCLHVGCIPKKIAHTAAHLLAQEKASRAAGDYEANPQRKKVLASMGWDEASQTHSFRKLQRAIQEYTRAESTETTQGLAMKITNFSPESAVYERTRVEVTNISGTGAEAQFGIRLYRYNEKAQEVLKEGRATVRQLVFAVGGRPMVMNGDLHQAVAARFASSKTEQHKVITSDDFFGGSVHMRSGDLKRVLIIGGGYIALETAGILKHMDPNREVFVAVRSEVLRSFAKVGGNALAVNEVYRDLRRLGVKFIQGLDVGGLKKELEKEYASQGMGEGEKADDTHSLMTSLLDEASDLNFDLVLAVGRYGNVEKLFAPAVLSARNSSAPGKIVVQVPRGPSGGDDAPLLLQLENGRIVIDGSTGQAMDAQSGSPIPNLRAVGDAVHSSSELVTMAKLEGERAGILAGRSYYERIKSMFDDYKIDDTHPAQVRLQRLGCVKNGIPSSGLPSVVFTPLEMFFWQAHPDAVSAASGVQCYYVPLRDARKPSAWTEASCQSARLEKEITDLITVGIAEGDRSVLYFGITARSAGGASELGQALVWALERQVGNRSITLEELQASFGPLPGSGNDVICPWDAAWPGEVETVTLFEGTPEPVVDYDGYVKAAPQVFWKKQVEMPSDKTMSAELYLAQSCEMRFLTVKTEENPDPFITGLRLGGFKDAVSITTEGVEGLDAYKAGMKMEPAQLYEASIRGPMAGPISCGLRVSMLSGRLKVQASVVDQGGINGWEPAFPPAMSLHPTQGEKLTVVEAGGVCTS